MLKKILGTIGSGVFLFIAVTGFRTLEGGAPEYQPPAPSDGMWDSEADDLPNDRPNEPSIFMTNYVAPSEVAASPSAPEPTFQGPEAVQ